MTWYSRLLRKERTASQRVSNRRRSMMTLEHLESRTVLSSVSVVYPAPGTTSGLLITGDTGNDNFVITENGNGSVTVSPGTTVVKPGVGVIPGSLINGLLSPASTYNPVSSIAVVLPGTTNFDIVNLNGQGATTPTGVGNVTVTATGANLTFGVGVAGTGTGVDNTGALTVSDIASATSNAVLNATVNGSTLGSLSITQLGNGPDVSTVALGSAVAGTGNTVAGTAFVSLGEANSDSITLTNNIAFGPTTLEEGQGDNGIAPAGPALGTSAGAHDTISVTGPVTGTSHYATLLAAQDVTPVPTGGGNNTNETITISNIQVAYAASNSPNPAGVTTTQGNGAFDTTTITNVTTYGLTIPINGLPAGIGVAAISVTQGNGSVGLTTTATGGVDDAASVSTSTVPGSISITQSDLAANSPMYNTALISGDKSTYSSLSITQGNAGGVLLANSTTVTKGDQATITGSTAGGNASISQGTGTNDTAVITSSTITGSATITQLDLATNPAGDHAQIGGISGGAASGSTGGSATITQGNANNDAAVINLTSIGGSATITQGNGTTDSAAIDVATVGGSASITQGGGGGDVAVITDPPTIGTVKGNVTITQGNGAGDVAVISYLTIGTAGTGNGNIGITQGNGNGDAAEIENVTDPGGTGGTTPAPITIAITQGNGNGDIAAIVNLTATGGTTAVGVPISITQGSGSGDWAEIANVTANNGNLTITQNDAATNAAGDTALVLNSTVGTTATGTMGTLNDFNGTVTITQGNAAGDIALVQGTATTFGTANNIAITQGSNGGSLVNGAPTLPNFNGSTVGSDVVEINDETVTSNITIVQGNSASVGYYVTAIAYDYLGYVSLIPALPTVPSQFTALVAPVAGSSSVTAGGITSILQSGANNQVYFGDPLSADYFYTTWLDVYTGAGGGAFVFASNTMTFGAAPLGGPFSSTYSIGGGGTGNQIWLDPTSQMYVSFDPASFVGYIY